MKTKIKDNFFVNYIDLIVCFFIRIYKWSTDHNILKYYLTSSRVEVYTRVLKGTNNMDKDWDDIFENLKI